MLRKREGAGKVGQGHEFDGHGSKRDDRIDRGFDFTALLVYYSTEEDERPPLAVGSVIIGSVERNDVKECTRI